MGVPLWLQHAIDTFGYLAIFVAVLLETMGVPFPGETALLAGAIYAGGVADGLAAGGRLNIVGVIVAGALGAIVGDNVGYTIGYFGGRPLLLRLMRLFHLRPEALEYTERYFERHGDKTVLLGRFFSLLRVWIALLAGVSHMPRRTFFVWNACGGILWAIIYGLLGYYLGRNLALLHDAVRAMGIAAVVAIAVAVVGTIVFFRRQRRKALRRADEVFPQSSPEPEEEEPV